MTTIKELDKKIEGLTEEVKDLQERRAKACIKVTCNSLICFIQDPDMDPYLVLLMHNAQLKQHFDFVFFI